MESTEYPSLPQLSSVSLGELPYPKISTSSTKRKGKHTMFNIRVQKSTLNDDKFPFYVKAGFHVAMLFHRNVNNSSILFTDIKL